MPCGVYQHAAAVMGGKIYVTGGETDEGSMNSVFVYDPQADAWTQLASMSTARRRHASAAVGGKLYVFGGDSSGVRPLARRRSTIRLRTAGSKGQA